MTMVSIAQRAISDTLLAAVLKMRPKKSRQLVLMKVTAAVSSIVMAQYIYLVLEAEKERLNVIRII